MEKKGIRLKAIASVLFILYLVLLVWIILFKLQFSLSDMDHRRSINLIPFYYSTAVGEQFHMKEVRDNVLIFIPFGIFLSILAFQLKLRSKILILLGTSFALEVMQYVLAVGGTDITDIITNVSGGVVGVILYSLLLKMLKDKQRVDIIILVIAVIVTVLFLGLIAFLIFAN